MQYEHSNEINVLELSENLNKECNKYYNIKFNGFELTKEGIKFNFTFFDYEDFEIKELVLSPGFAFFQNKPENVLPRTLINGASAYFKLIKKIGSN